MPTLLNKLFDKITPETKYNWFMCFFCLTIIWFLYNLASDIIFWITKVWFFPKLLLNFYTFPGFNHFYLQTFAVILILFILSPFMYAEHNSLLIKKKKVFWNFKKFEEDNIDSLGIIYENGKKCIILHEEAIKDNPTEYNDNLWLVTQGILNYNVYNNIHVFSLNSWYFEYIEENKKIKNKRKEKN